MRSGDGPRRRRMIRGTIARIGELAMRYGFPSQLATLDCTSSRRSTVMCALPRATTATTVYQRDSSSKRPRSSVAFAARVPSCIRDPTWRARRLGLRALWAAPSAPLDAAPATWAEALGQASIERSGLDRGSFHIRLASVLRWCAARDRELLSFRCRCRSCVTSSRVYPQVRVESHQSRGHKGYWTIVSCRPLRRRDVTLISHIDIDPHHRPIDRRSREWFNRFLQRMSLGDLREEEDQR